MNLGESLRETLQTWVEGVIGYLPSLLNGLFILVFGWLVARLVRGALVGIFSALPLERIPARLGGRRFFSRGDVRYSLANLLANLAYLFLLVLFVDLAAQTLKLPGLSAFIEAILAFIPRFLLALAVFFLVWALGRVVFNILHGELLRARLPYADLVARSIYAFILVLGVAMALEELRVATDLLTWGLLILIGAAGFGLALGVGLALGLGLKDLVRDRALALFSSKSRSEEQDLTESE